MLLNKQSGNLSNAQCHSILPMQRLILDCSGKQVGETDGYESPEVA
jgi:hypothetical protein